jgi:multiple sugar transport system ATP-binding protein
VLPASLQIGTPKELYEAPLNRFVAGFIGSPSMNFVPMSLEENGGGTRLTGEGAEVALDDAQAAMLRGRAGQSILMGVRPEHLNVGGGDGAGLKLTAAVDVIEFLGNDELIHAQSAGRDMVAIVDTDAELKVGEKVVLTAAPRRLHLFDPDTGLRLGRG